MIPNHYMKNRCFTKHSLKNGCLGCQVVVVFCPMFILTKPNFEKPCSFEFGVFLFYPDSIWRTLPGGSGGSCQVNWLSDGLCGLESNFKLFKSYKARLKTNKGLVASPVDVVIYPLFETPLCHI